MATLPSALSGRPTALVLSGGNALGAYHGGTYEALHESGHLPGWVVGNSIGAINAAIIAGNRPEDRLAKLRKFWAAMAGPEDFGLVPQLREWRRLYNALSAMQTRFFGRPGLFTPRVPMVPASLPGMRGDVSLYDTAPLRETLVRFTDFGRINGGEVRLTIGALDVQTGEDVFLDTTRGDRIKPAHLLASVALIPDFPPVEVGGRYLCDAALSSNTPLDAVLGELPQEDMLCFAVDLFDRRNARPASLDAVIGRGKDLQFGSQTRRMIQARQTEYRLRHMIHTLAARVQADQRADPELRDIAAEGRYAEVVLAYLAYRAGPQEVALKTFDFSRASLSDRWGAGRAGMAEALRVVSAHATRRRRRPGLTVYDIGGPERTEERGREAAPPAA